MQSLKKIFRPIISRSNFLSRNYRTWRDGRDMHKAPQPTPFGFLFNGNEAMRCGNFEPVETSIIRKLLPRVSAVINVGANIGYYCCFALSAGKSVVAFEPITGNQRYLYRNVFANGWGASFECFPIALSSKVGLIEIYGGGTGASLVRGWAGQHYSNIVPVSTMDVVLGDRFVDCRPLVIIDVEGAEYGVLQGAHKMLGSQNKPLWFVEVSVGEHQPSGVQINPDLMRTFKLFASHGYRAMSADQVPREITLGEIENIGLTKVDTLGTHNFIFVDSEIYDDVRAIIS